MMTDHISTLHSDRVGTTIKCTCGWRTTRLWATRELAYVEFYGHKQQVTPHPFVPYSAKYDMPRCKICREFHDHPVHGECTICDGSGILHVADSVQDLKAERTEASYCHACSAGRAWREAGLE